MEYKLIDGIYEDACDGCIFLDCCCGDGDGTPIEGYDCPHGKVWAREP